MKVTAKIIAEKKELAATGNKGSILDSGRVKVLTNFNLSDKKERAFTDALPKTTRVRGKVYVQ